MRVAVLTARQTADRVNCFMEWVDPLANKVLVRICVPEAPNLGVFPKHNCVLVSHSTPAPAGASQSWLDIYRLADGSMRDHMPMDWRAHFNVTPSWPIFLSSPDQSLIYIYKTRTLGHHLAEDYLCALDPMMAALSPWNFKIPGCVAGWSPSGGRAHVQMLFVADGLEVGRLPTTDLDQKIGFWLGPDEGMGPMVSLGPRPRAHSTLGHARAILFAPAPPLSVVVCTDGVTHLIDPVEFRYVERQLVELSPGQAMPQFAAQIEPAGQLLYVGTSAPEARSQGLIERVVVHNLKSRQRQAEWLLPEPFVHMALSADGRNVCGAGLSNKLWVLDTRSGQAEAAMQLAGNPQYLVLATDSD
jgi:hypothetical protein